MAESNREDVFVQVEAMINNEWVKKSRKSLTQILEEIEDLGVGGIQFRKGNHIVQGSLDQLIRIREHLLGNVAPYHADGLNERASHGADRGACAPMRVERPRDLDRDIFSRKSRANELMAAEFEPDLHPKKISVNSSKGRDEPMETKKDSGEGQPEIKELLVDVCIWEYIESKKAEEMRDLEEMFLASLTRTEDDSGVLKIGIKPKSPGTEVEELELMYESLVTLYEEMLNRCVIETHEARLPDKTASLILEFISKSFPEVLAKRCFYNDDFLFIGPARQAREARKQFQTLELRMKPGRFKTVDNERLELMNRKFSQQLFPKIFPPPTRSAVCNKDRNEDLAHLLEDRKFSDDFDNAYNDLAIKEVQAEYGVSEVEEVTLPGNVDQEEKYFEEKKKLMLDDTNYLDSDVISDGDWELGLAGTEVKSFREKEKKPVPLQYSDFIDDRGGDETLAVERNVGRLCPKVDKNVLGSHDLRGKDLEHVEEIKEKTMVAAAEMDSGEESECKDGMSKAGKLEREGMKAAKSLEGFSDGDVGEEMRKTEDDGRERKHNQVRKNDADDLLFRSLDTVDGQTGQEGTATQNMDSSGTETTEKKREKKRKIGSKPVPKVTIVKQKPNSSVLVETKTDNQPKVVTEAKVFEEINIPWKAKYGAVKVPHVEHRESSPRGLKKTESSVKEMFRMQRKTLQKRPFDSPSSSETDDEDKDPPARQGRTRLPERNGAAAAIQREDSSELNLEDPDRVEEMIETLISRDDKKSQEKLQSLLEKVTEKRNPERQGLCKAKKPVKSTMEDEDAVGYKDFYEALPAKGGQKIQENLLTLPQPPGGSIGCVFDKAFHLKGHDKCGTIEINISFEAGSQANDQPDPGRPFKGMTMKAYLPASGDGRETLRVMKETFGARKLFAIRQSENEGDDVIVPNDVIFKESADQFPDPGYLPRVLEQLKVLAG